VHDPEYPGIAEDDDAARNEERDDEQSRFGGVLVVVLQDSAGPQFAIQAEHTWKEQQSGSYLYPAVE
jgi:hypothetical protein